MATRIATFFLVAAAAAPWACGATRAVPTGLPPAGDDEKADAAGAPAPMDARIGGDAVIASLPRDAAVDMAMSPVSLDAPRAPSPDGRAGVAGDMGVDRAGADAASGCVTAKICDDFESYVPGGSIAPWKANVSGGTVAVDGVHAYSGKAAAHIHATPGGNHRAQLVRAGAPLFPADGNAFWGRMMVYATNFPQKSDTEDKNVHFDVIQADGAQLSDGQYRIAGMGNFLLNYEPHDCYYGTNKPIPENRWACWEWLYDGAKNTIDFYVDGVLQAHLMDMGQGCVDNTKSIWAAPQFSNLRLGWINYQSMSQTVDMWLDDVAAGPARIGCGTSDSAH